MYDYEHLADGTLEELIRHNTRIANNPRELPRHQQLARKRLTIIQSELRQRRLARKQTIRQRVLKIFLGGDEA